MKKAFYILTIILFNSCQDNNIEGTWIGDYTYPTDNKELILPIQKLIQFENGKAYFKGSKNSFGKEIIEGKYSLFWNNIKFNDQYENYKIQKVNKDSLVLKNDASSFIQIFKRVPDSLKNDKNIRLTGNLYRWVNEKFTDTIFFKNDSIIKRKTNNFSQNDNTNWERINFNGFDVIFMEGDVPFIIQNSNKEDLILWTFHKNALQHKFKRID